MKKAMTGHNRSAMERRGGEFFFFFDASLWARISGGEKRERYAPPPNIQEENKNYTIRFFRIYVTRLSLQNFVSILNRQNAFYRRAKERKKNGYARTF